jgi:hypothetical protein
VLAGLLIETVDGGDGLQLSTFDYETSARATLPASVQDEGKALVSGRLLADICRSLPNKPVEMTTDGSKVSLTCGSARFSLQTMPVEEYPTLPDMPQATGTVRSDVFANAVASIDRLDQQAGEHGNAGAHRQAPGRPRDCVGEHVAFDGELHWSWPPADDACDPGEHPAMRGPLVVGRVVNWAPGTGARRGLSPGRCPERRSRMSRYL